MRPTAKISLLISAASTVLSSTFGQVSIVVEFPDPATIYGNATVAVDALAGFVPSFNENKLWSFSLLTGEILHTGGLPLPAPAVASNAYLFSAHRLAVPGWFPNAGLLIVDVTDPRAMKQVGAISLPSGSNIQGQSVAIADDGVIGYAASIPNDTLYSFNVGTLALEDPDGLPLPGNPDRIARAGNRIAIVDTTNGRIMVADISNPADLQFAGVIELPGTNTFGSNDNIAFAADGRTGFVSDNQRVLHSFDVQTLQVLDPDGLLFGAGSFGDHVATHGTTVAATSSRGLSFIDASNPANLTLKANADFGQTVSLHPDGTVAFTPDGRYAAVATIWPANRIYVFEVATGVRVGFPVDVDEAPSHVFIYGGTNRVSALCTRANDGSVWLIDGLFGLILGDVNCDQEVGFGDINPFVLALTDPAGYAIAFPDCELATADINGDGRADFGDINPFVALLTAP